jgi:RNA polymerase subunit RPABC4/transcription elongation factor Spt4
MQDNTGNTALTVIWLGSGVLGIIILMAKGYASKALSGLGGAGCMLLIFLDSFIGLFVLAAIAIAAPLVFAGSFFAPTLGPCPNCRKWFRRDANVCPYCSRARDGTLPQSQVYNGAVFHQQANFNGGQGFILGGNNVRTTNTNTTGNQQSVACSHCGASINPQSKFCQNCGFPVTPYP